jgi:N6-L-threonylcarbamoyladenine synthase
MTGPGLDFSFSGLKTAVVRAAEKRPDLSLPDVAAAFQAAVCEQLLRKLRHAIQSTEVHGIALAGGVAANSALRTGVSALAVEFGIEAHLPSLAMCTDNAAMIAAAGQYRLAHDGPSNFDLSATPNWQLSEVL